MLGTEEEDRWEDEGGHLLDENGNPIEEKNEDEEELVLKNHPADPGFLSWKKLKN